MLKTLRFVNNKFIFTNNITEVQLIKQQFTEVNSLHKI